MVKQAEAASLHSSVLDRLGILTDELPGQIDRLKTLRDDLNLQIGDLFVKQRDPIIEQDRVIASYNTTMADFWLPYNLARDLVNYPSNYPDVIKIMRSESQSTLTYQ